MEKNKNNKKKMKINKNFIYIGIAVILLIAIILLFTLTNNKEDKKDNNKTTTTTKVVEEKKLNIVDLNSTSRPYAVMINNIGVARPLQSGLQDAYIIYEIIVEGGLSRYMALFLDQNTERIGSIRSSRHYFLDYALENDAIYVHHGQSPQAAADFKKLNVNRIVADNSKTGWRDKTLNVSSEHTLFTNIEKLNSGLGKIRTTRNGNLLLTYSVDSVELSTKKDSKVANEVKIVYSKSVVDTYSYDATNKVYMRSVNGKAHTDYVTGKQYTFKNIITYQVENSTIAGDKKGRQTIDNIGSGTGYYISEGYAVPIKWKKESRSSKTVYTYEDGTELVVNDGNTFIQIQPKNQELSIN